MWLKRSWAYEVDLPCCRPTPTDVSTLEISAEPEEGDLPILAVGEMAGAPPKHRKAVRTEQALWCCTSQKPACDREHRPRVDRYRLGFVSMYPRQSPFEREWECCCTRCLRSYCGRFLELEDVVSDTLVGAFWILRFAECISPLPLQQACPLRTVAIQKVDAGSTL